MISITEKQLEEELMKRFSGEKIRVVSVKRNTSGRYKSGADWFNMLVGISSEVKNLPDYVDVRIKWSTGGFEEDIIVW